jgi:hypothetical protein
MVEEDIEHRHIPGRCRKTPDWAPIRSSYGGRLRTGSKPFQMGC